jgi:antibiotic biosynthesis monooxygenase (ABM) superfamily enzyme
MSVMYVINAEVNPVDEATWDEWQTTLHMPDVLRQPGFLRGTKYKVDAPVGGWSHYLIMYEVVSREALDAYLAGEEVARLRADHYSRFGTSTRLSRLILTPTVTVERPNA